MRRVASAGAEGELPEALARLDPAVLELVCAEVLDSKSNVAWEDIAGQGPAKRLVQELVVWPMLNPHLFQARGRPAGLAPQFCWASGEQIWLSLHANVPVRQPVLQLVMGSARHLLPGRRLWGRRRSEAC